MASTPSFIDQRKAALRVMQLLQQMVAPRFFTPEHFPGLGDLHEDVANAFKNAVLDGGLVATRAFNEFLSSNKKYPDDLNWSDFPGLAQSAQFLPAATSKELHKAVAHLSIRYIETEVAFPVKPGVGEYDFILRLPFGIDNCLYRLGEELYPG